MTGRNRAKNAFGRNSEWPREIFSIRTQSREHRSNVEALSRPHFWSFHFELPWQANYSAVWAGVRHELCVYGTQNQWPGIETRTVGGKTFSSYRVKGHAQSGGSLSQFGNRDGEGKGAYRRFVAEGVQLGRRPELVGGGLVRSQGGWSEVKSLRRRAGREMADERILGSGNFVERVIREAEARAQRLYAG
jgi:hypothetical protein